MKRRGLLGAALLAAPLLLALASDGPARWLVCEDPAGPVDAVVVLAGDPDYERTQAGAELLLRGEAQLLVLTGGEPGPGDSAWSLRRKALELGVPAARIRIETRSRSTREEMLAVAPILAAEGVRSVALVTSSFHQRRAFLAARRAWPGTSIRNRPVPRRGTGRWWRNARSREAVLTEYAKLAYYALRGWL